MESLDTLLRDMFLSRFMDSQGLPYVNQQAFELAQKLERILHLLPAESGIYFAGVHAVPVPGGESNVFDVTVGIDRAFETKTIEIVVSQVLMPEMLEGFKFNLKVVRGLAGPASYKALPRPDSAQA
jgi:hypothetical protein